MIALIDADSIVYIIAWNYREGGTREEVERSCDIFLKDMLTVLGTTKYIGAFSVKSDYVFRTETYRYARYKGKRPEKSENVQNWEEVIKGHFMQKYGFITLPKLEADDIIAGTAHFTKQAKIPYVICSPDKDLRQIPGHHFDYRVPQGETPSTYIDEVSEVEAHWNFWTQMLTGDEGDNIAGIPGLGPMKAKKIIDPLKEEGDLITTANTVLGCYNKYFGEYYGGVIFRETLQALRLMTPMHPLWPEFNDRLMWASGQIKELVTRSSMFDISS